MKNNNRQISNGTRENKNKQKDKKIKSPQKIISHHSGFKYLHCTHLLYLKCFCV